MKLHRGDDLNIEDAVSEDYIKRELKKERYVPPSGPVDTDRNF